MVQTIKFSQFPSGGDLVASDIVAGLDQGNNNTKFTVEHQFVADFTTLTRPTPPAAGMIGYNTTTQTFEWYNGTDWSDLGSTQDLLAFIARLAAHTAGDGASLVGLQDQSNVSSKTVQDLANAKFIVQTNNGSLQNAQATGSLGTGILRNTSGSGVLSISIPLTSIDNLVTAADEMIYTTSSNVYATTPLTALARSLLADATQIDMQTTLGLGSAATHPTSFFLQTANNLSDLNSIPVAVSNLGLTIGSQTEAWSPVLDALAAGTYPGATSITILGTITTGLWHGTTIDVAHGGTGATSFTPYSVICGGTSPSSPLQNVVAPGALGSVLTSTGPGSLPVFAFGSGSVTPATIQNQNFTYGIDTGISEIYVTDLTPPILGLVAGLRLSVLIANTNTGPSTLLVNGLGPKAIVNSDLTALAPNALLGGMIADFEYDGTQFQLMNSALSGAGGGVTPLQIQTAAFTSSADTGIADAYIGTLSPAITAYTDQMLVSFTPANNSVTTFPTIAFNGLAPVPLAGLGNSILPAGALIAGIPALLLYSSTYTTFTLLNPASAPIWNAGTGLYSTYGGNAFDGGFNYTLAWGPGAQVSANNGTAIGLFAHAVNAGSMVLSDSLISGNITDIAANQLAAVFAGGFIFSTDISHNPVWDISSIGTVTSHFGEALMGKSLQNPVSGDTLSIIDTFSTYILAPSAPVVGLTLNLPAVPDGQIIRISTTNDITGLVIVPSGGDSISNAPTSLAAGQGLELIYWSSMTNWYPLYQPSAGGTPGTTGLTALSYLLIGA